MADESNRHAASLREAATAWETVRLHYSEPETQEQLWSALDGVPDDSDDWARVWGLAARTLHDFILAGRPLQRRADDLAAQAVQLEGQLSTTGLSSSADDDGSAAEEFLRRQVQQHNQAVVQLNHAWQTLQSDTEQELDALQGHGGVEESIPTAYADGGSGLTPGVGPTYSGGRLSFNVGTASAAVFGPGTTASSRDFAPGFALAAVLSTLQRDPVERAEDLYKAATGPDCTVEDVGDFYDHLTAMSADEIKDFARENPQVNRGNLPTPSSQEELDGWPDGAQWWHEQLDEEQQEALTSDLPVIVGNTEGVPYEVRDQANKSTLIGLLDSPSTPDEHLPYLENIQDSVIGDEDSQGERLLLSLNVGVTGVDDHPPLASVSIGNPDDAEQTVFNAPGMNSGTDQMTKDHEPGEVDHAQDVYDELLARRLGWVLLLSHGHDSYRSSRYGLHRPSDTPTERHHAEEGVRAPLRQRRRWVLGFCPCPGRSPCHHSRRGQP
ncbi:hypothetical protein [Nesterenkonia sp. K-15-9-6]|uniref:hypothetical protein n=1 Tax=Nesterenkonia sp. K-15-9-6 TaxID=3093918 RepID=UPI0040449BBC